MSVMRLKGDIEHMQAYPEKDVCYEEDEQSGGVSRSHVQTQIFLHAGNASVRNLGRFQRGKPFLVGSHLTLTLSTSDMAYNAPSIGNNLISILRIRIFSKV